jgi:hypothetical protein
VIAKHDDLDRMVIGMWSVGSIYTDPCNWLGTSIRPEPSVDDIVATFVEHRQTPPPIDVVVDGYAGKRIELQVPTDIELTDCVGDEYRSWTDAAGGVRWHQGPGQIDELLILDVDGVPLLIDVHHFPQASDDELAEQQQVVDSIRIDPRPSE